MAKRTFKKKKIKYVIDTNIFVISLTSRSPYHYIFSELINGNFELLVSNDILLEYEEIIITKYGKKTADYFLALLAELPNVIFVTPFYNWNLIKSDPDDNKFIDCAIVGLADFIVSEDKHFDSLKNIPFPIVRVIGIKNFIKLTNKHLS
ncbi:MAG: putative toxin-antitoxin system toxin component, PIN family [Bacteroidetes bacterium CG02_land_8_20_14_3_00_31_25]|nr:putative toxin-antitoxin system toxin component, PIN family [Bacteroidota bacterium]PIV58577.1 MAG: putative toxin-antitoxin system toxin component, PIN family [Bacteroidetes bacterium CG02_land_8_20_14_3_00_31_25]PIX34447.1 MAG: putative toxin-antitoxin system toxin component, PIN family [Bacteroidetes bacterium CG_4_8_14_3_um_filter_31_14]PIY06307.1 MAG: putative toxin-antitoxin system toxin component, PIN family [Bacteroidetes bacterium CG_4_10_14_3_um_filter_31_20]